jgi:hypothetical protein
MHIQEWLFKYHKKGYSFFNTKCNEKKVYTKWEEFQTRKPTDQEIKQWLRLPTQNYAIVCGEISDLLVIDVDTKNGGDPTPFLNRGFYEVRTPSGGYHFYFKYDPALKSTKHDQKGFLKGIDIQSERALVFCPPSTFPSKGVYTLVNDAPIESIPDDLLLRILEALEPEEDAVEYVPNLKPKNPESRRPGDIFNALATWEDVLLPLGWTRVGNNHNGTQYWRRPGKTDGISASTNWKGYDLFFPYTTSVDDLVQKKGYTKFTLLATLRYEGDFNKAAVALVHENYRLAYKLI